MQRVFFVLTVGCIFFVGCHTPTAKERIVKARSLSQGGDVEKALAEYEAAFKLDEGADAVYHLEAADLYFRTNRNKETLLHCSKAMLFLLSRGREMTAEAKRTTQEDRKNELNCYLEERINPYLSFACQMRAQVYARMGELENAIEECARACDYYEKNLRAGYLLPMLLEKAGEKEKALEAWDEFVSLYRSLCAIDRNRYKVGEEELKFARERRQSLFKEVYANEGPVSKED